jgi:hypothetical protein
MRTARRIRRYIEAELLDGPCEGDPLAVRALDSLAIEELIAHIEESYRIHLDEDDIVPEHFASLGALAALVDAKRRAR